MSFTPVMPFRVVSFTETIFAGKMPDLFPLYRRGTRGSNREEQ